MYSCDKRIRIMSGERKIEKVDLEDIENFSGKNDIFQKVYGSNVVADAQAKTEELKKQCSMGFVNKGLDVDTNARLSVFEKEKIYDGDWTASTLNLLESWYKACKDSAVMYAEAARGARKKHRAITIPTIVAGTAATALSFFNAGSDCSGDGEENHGLSYSVAFLTSMVSILGGVSALYSFKSKTEKCISAAGSFECLAKRVQTQLFLPNKLRAHSELVLSEVSTEFANLTMNSPLL